MEEMTQVAEAVARAFRPQKMNYELLGMGDAHLHWHLFPRRDGDIVVSDRLHEIHPSSFGMVTEFIFGRVGRRLYSIISRRSEQHKMQIVFSCVLKWPLL